MQKTIFFWVIVVQFSISFLITVLGVIGWVHISDSLLKTLTGVLIVEQAGAVLAIFKATDFFDSKHQSTKRDGIYWLRCGNISNENLLRIRTGDGS